jgi:hypothetical protein
MFCELKSLFFLLLFVHYSFSFAQAWNSAPITFQISQNEAHMMKI